MSPILCNSFLERIMSDAMDEHNIKVSQAAEYITNLRFASGIDALAQEQQEVEDLVAKSRQKLHKVKDEFVC